MKRNLCKALMVTVACLSLYGCGEGTGTEESSIFEPQQGISTESQGEQLSGSHNKANDQNNSNDTGVAENGGSEIQNGDSAEAAPTSSDGGVSICDETTTLDYSKDYTDEIRVAVERAVSEATSFEDEFDKMGKIQDHITSRRNQDSTQVEMNMAASLYFQVWDAELNSLWNRFSESVDAQTKERVLEKQRHWNAMKQDAALEALGPQDQGGSIYPLLYDSFMEESTKGRCYELAKEIAAAKGTNFVMPEKQVQGVYVDNEGTDSIYSSLSVTESMESGYDARVSLYRTGEITGTVTEDGAGTFIFVSDDESIKADVTYGWDGATFEVTEAGEDAIVNAGDKFEFPLVF